MQPQPLREIDPRGRAGTFEIKCRHGCRPHAASHRWMAIVAAIPLGNASQKRNSSRTCLVVNPNPIEESGAIGILACRPPPPSMGRAFKCDRVASRTRSLKWAAPDREAADAPCV